MEELNRKFTVSRGMFEAEVADALDARDALGEPPPAAVESLLKRGDQTLAALKGIASAARAGWNSKDWSEAEVQFAALQSLLEGIYLLGYQDGRSDEARDNWNKEG